METTSPSSGSERRLTADEPAANAEGTGSKRQRTSDEPAANVEGAIAEVASIMARFVDSVMATLIDLEGLPPSAVAKIEGVRAEIRREFEARGVTP